MNSGKDSNWVHWLYAVRTGTLTSMDFSIVVMEIGYPAVRRSTRARTHRSSSSPRGSATRQAIAGVTKGSSWSRQPTTTRPLLAEADSRADAESGPLLWTRGGIAWPGTES